MLHNLTQNRLLRKLLDWSESDTAQPILTALIVVLVGLSGFGLGRLSAAESGISIGAPVLQGAAAEATAGSLDGAAPATAGGEVIASKNGSKYHAPWCSGAKTISEANRITFASAEEARKAGYAPASNCKGLK